ncbi:UDP-glucose 4-epimerase GalE [Culicoidibacter larvae]|uniref:UDP-glucose 4-epimerase n=1 Tax=Culicoidibacter larvae TaxID=2579976 RepID=A0A5R8QDD1_9FIRM|nr:UDP-glucose 4-epimerase GalE [Culicoidibacter larvae]TLG75241.1 UDP-glucose 4-epimerase GalE [Culicoidibacter larvae]
MRVLVVGGAGYIGSHTVYELIRSGHEVVVYDNLSTGNTKAIHREATFVEGDIRDKIMLDAVFEEHGIDAVMHFAAKIVVPESVEQPAEYFENNVYGVGVLLQAMRDAKVDKFIFSSTAAVYGMPNQSVPITEDAETKPINPYGESKLSAEKLIGWCEAPYGIKYTIFRYFNVAGADGEGQIGLSPKTVSHIIPSTNEAVLGLRDKLIVFGTDYNTEDGTCIRDYIHVTDLARAHVLGVEKLAETMTSKTYNLGSSNGFSVKDIVTTTEEVLAEPVPVEYGPRRAGDPDYLVASNKRAEAELGWVPEYDLASMIESDYNWRKAPKYEYEGK